MTDAHQPDREILVKPETVCCPAHGEHLRAHFPAGFVIVAMTLIQDTLTSDDFIRAVDPTWDGQDGTAQMDIGRVNEILATKPMCYWVPRDAIRKALMDSEIGQIGRCDTCHRSGLGGPYDVSLPVGTQTLWLCFECALDAGEKLHRAHPDGQVWPEAA